MQVRHKSATVLTAVALGAITALAGTGSPAAAAPGNSYYHDFPGGVRALISLPEQSLNSGNTWTLPNTAKLTLQANGKLKVISTSGQVRFETNAVGRNSQLRFQTDGNLVLYSADGVNRWSSRTGTTVCQGGQKVLSLQSDTNVVIYCRKPALPGPSTYYPIWATNTADS